MALATKCPHCNTTFRVALEQLTLRDGIVRCGFCNDIFDGNAALVDLTPDLPAVLSTFTNADGVAEATSTPFYVDDARVEHYLDADTDDNSAQPMQAPEFDEWTNSNANVNLDTEQFTASTEIHFNLGEDDISARSAQAVSRLTAVKTIVTEPAFVKQGRRRASKRLRLAWWAGVILLMLTLLMQGMYTWRNQLAARVPALRTALTTLCAAARCRIELPAQIESLTIDQGELQTLTEFTFSFATVLHNQAGTAQAWPNMEVILNDASEQPVLRRVLTPHDYLASSEQAQTIAAGFAANSEQAIKIEFELAGLHASGYHIAVFYP